MKGRQPKISKENYPQKDRTASEDYVGVQTFMGITENNLTSNYDSEHGMLETILSPPNLEAAYKQVKRNKGAGGVDKMDIDSLQDYLVENRERLLTSLLRGNYRPNPVRRVEIPKGDGSKRKLGIPTVVDRVIQQAIAQVLTPIYEPKFSEHSYGFRPKRSAHQALRKCRQYITEGSSYAVDLDMEKFFDTVSHSKLIEVLSRTIKDGRVVSLIHQYLNAGVLQGDIYEADEFGVPQGGPLSPLLSNIMLNELDRKLESRGHKFVRYADDVIILCSSRRSAERTLRNIMPFIEEDLFLKVNREKSQVVPIREVNFLGYSFYKTKGKGRLRIHPKSFQKMKAKIKELTSRSNGWGNHRRKEALRSFIAGWVQYFKLADMDKLMVKVDEWYRRRLRMVIWKQWKWIKTKMRKLMRLGVKKSKAWEWANTRKGYWHTAKGYILTTTITNDRLRKTGYMFLTDYYRQVRVA